MSDPRWTVDEDEHASTVWFDLGNGETFEPWEALPGTVEAQNLLGSKFDAAYDALVECVRSHDTLTRARQLAAAASNVHATGMERYQAGSALLDLLTGEGQ